MFNRKVRDRSATIDKIDLDTLKPRAKCQDNDFYVPYVLHDCIENAVEKKDFAEIKHIHDALAKLPKEIVSMDGVIDRFYFHAIVHSYKPQEFSTLLDCTPIDINRPIHHLFQGGCRPPETEIDSLLHLAIDFDEKELVVYLVNNHADLNAKSNKGETPSEKVQKRIDKLEKLITAATTSQMNKNYLTECKKDLEEMLKTITDAEMVNGNRESLRVVLS